MANIKYAYITLDSLHGIYSDDGKKITWPIIKNLYESHVGTHVVDDIRDITEIKLLSASMPRTSLKTAVVLIDECLAQSFSLPNGNKFHFIAKIEDCIDLLINEIPVDVRNVSTVNKIYMPDYTLLRSNLLLSYKTANGTYKFHTPITDLSSVTLSICDPFEQIKLPKYRFDNVQTSLIGTNLTLTFPEPHGYLANATFQSANLDYDCYSLYIDGFSSDSPADATLVDWINNREHTSIKIMSSTSILVRLAEALPAGVNMLPIPQMVVPGIVGNPSKCIVRFNGCRMVFNLVVTYLPQVPN